VHIAGREGAAGPRVLLPHRGPKTSLSDHVLRIEAERHLLTATRRRVASHGTVGFEMILGAVS